MQRQLTKLGNGPLRPLARGLYRALTATARTYLRRSCPGASVYAARSLASGELIPGLSDLDMVVVIPADSAIEHERLRRRWDRLTRILPRGVAPDLTIYERTEFDRAAAASLLTYGLDHEPHAAALFGEAPPHDESELRARPGLGAPAADWHLIAGREVRPAPSPPDRDRLLSAAWLELQFWWRSAFDAIAHADRPWAAYSCVKLVSEPARILLALGGRPFDGTRRETLRAAATSFPADTAAFEDALELLGQIGSAPAAPLQRFLPHLTALSARIAAELGTAVSAEPRTEVELLGAEAGSSELPLADWRAVVAPSLPDEVFSVIGGDPGDTERLRAAAAASATPGTYAALGDRRDLLVLPVFDVWRRGILRAVQCPLTDPVSFALLAGSSSAGFPGIRGWSAADWAARAVAEHTAWLRRSLRQQPFDPTAREWLDGAADGATGATLVLSKLLTAARAALFAQSLADGEPQLAVTVAAAAARLAELGLDPSGVAAEAAAAIKPPRPSDQTAGEALFEPMRALVGGLPAYAGAVPSS